MNDGVSFDEGYQDDDAYDTRPLASGEHRQYTASDYLDDAPADDLSVDFAAHTEASDRVAVIATEPLTRDEAWHAAAPGVLQVFEGGRLTGSVPTAG